MDGKHQPMDELPSDVDQLRAMLLAAREQVQQLSSVNSELSSTVSEQQRKLEQKEQQIVELLRALRGKQRERINPDQLLLFDIGELEKLIAEDAKPAEDPTSDARPRKRRR